MEREPVICQKCKTPFVNLVTEELEGFKQLRSGRLLILKLEANCIKCGWKLFWNVHDKDIEKMAVAYGHVVQLYVAE